MDISEKAVSYSFSNDWFESTAKGVWDALIPSLRPTRILEIGSYEGASACYLIRKCASDYPLELHCIDTWEGGIEHVDRGEDMKSVESRFLHNVDLASSEVSNVVNLNVHKGYSSSCLPQLLANGFSGHFDFIYIDGSHQAPDVLSDAVLSFSLLREGGVIAFDDYLWAEDMSYGRDPLRCPKPAIDAFINIYFRKVEVISAPLYQMYIRKTLN